MAYKKFKPTVWSAEILTNLAKQLCFKKHSDFKYEGEIKQGGRVEILGVGSPTIKDYDSKKEIDAPETLKDASIFLDIDQAKYFNIEVGDVDKIQKLGMLDAFSDEATTKLAEAEDVYCAKKIALGSGNKLSKTKITSTAEAKDVVNAMFKKAYQNNVSLKQQLELYIDPVMYDYLYDLIVTLKTENNKTVENGIVGTYRNATVIMTNCLHNDGEYTYNILKTPKSFALADGIDEIEAYRPEKKFADAIKGLHCYGGLVTRPKEIVTVGTQY